MRSRRKLRKSLRNSHHAANVQTGPPEVQGKRPHIREVTDLGVDQGLGRQNPPAGLLHVRRKSCIGEISGLTRCRPVRSAK